MGLDVYLSSPGVPKGKYGLVEDLDSAAYPDHLFKRNYLRSSYNGSGFDVVVGVLTGHDLHWIFEPAGVSLDGYTFRPTKAALRACRKRALSLVEELLASEALGVEFYSSVPSRPQDGIIESDDDALAKYREQGAGRAAAGLDNPGWGSYSNAIGTFYLDSPLSVRAVIPGVGFMGAGVYVVFDRSDKDWYIQAAKIVVEFIDYALSQNRPTIRWSG